MFYKRSDGGFKEAMEGIELKTLVYGDKTSMTEFHLAAGAKLPAHTHPHEQTGFVVSGRLRISVEGETFEAGPGDSWCIPGAAEHSAEVIEDSVVVEVFSPVREDLLPER